jgi:hypothetical protein
VLFFFGPILAGVDWFKKEIKKSLNILGFLEEYCFVS